MIDPNEKLRVVELAPFNHEWSTLFNEEALKIKAILQENCLAIHHIGSTAIPGICAKPIIDMLPIVKDIKLVDALNAQFEALGYVCMGEYGIAGRRFYWKSKQQRTHHIHLFEEHAAEIARHLAFKDFMVAHTEYAHAYSVIKENLAKVFRYDIENYVNGKSSFVHMIEYKIGTARSSQLNANDHIIIEPYNPVWPKLAEAEINTIKTLAQKLPFVAMEHLGSTSVPGLSSKPIIDIFISIPSITQASEWIQTLEKLGYVFWDENPNKNHLRFFKGMPPFGMQRTHHIHILEADDASFEHRVVFRDILRNDEKIKLAYESLKLTLAKDHIHDRELYTNLKGEFIEQVLHTHGYTKPISR